MFQGEQKRYPSNVLQRMKFLKFRLHGALLVEFDWSLSHPPEIQDEIHWNCDMWKSWSHSLRLLMALNYLFSFQRNFRGNSCYTMLYLLEIAVLLSLTWQIEQQSRTCLAFFSPPSEVRGEMWQNHQLPLSILPWTIWTYMNPLRCLPRTWVWWKSNAVCSIFSIPAFLVMRSTCPWLRTASCNRKMAIRWSKYLPFAPFLCTFHHLFRPLPWKFSKS